jgi:bifunctional UDP-N-acetylglucosamine pyrophosphorylase/glucosamine-1-phosphate N-acetyltransferase
MKPETFREAINEGRREHVRAVVVTMRLDNPFGYGRIIRDENGNIARIVEEKDASDAEKRIKEVNTGTYYFDAKLLFEGLSTVGTDNAQKEYYLPDVIQYIRQKGFLVKPLLLKDPLEGAGINSKEELQRIEELIQEKSMHNRIIQM